MAEAKVEASNEFKAAKALKDKDLDEFRMLMLEDLDINSLQKYNAKSKEKETLLHVAIRCKSLKGVQTLIKFKADINKPTFPSGNTPMHYASMYAVPEIVKLLLDKGATSTENNNKGKNPIQIIGSKLKNKNSIDALDRTTETQLLLLDAGSKKAINVQQELTEDIQDAEAGLQGLKMESNAKIKAVVKAQKRNFDSTHPYLRCKTDRIKVWEQNNKTTIRDFLAKKYIKIKVPMWSFKNETHIDLSKVQSFQITMALTILEQNGLKLYPEPFPGKPPKAAKILKDKSQVKKKADKKKKAGASKKKKT
mmetsp:Transcript_97137/g.118970  ORF Transcript_97137/g.118970 Transcript_97137/m.118970 type:complete len:308 (-) Transcript_97137:136-1059(-)